MQSLSEELLRAGSPAAIAQILARDVPEMVNAAAIRLYLYDSATKSLRSVACVGGLEPVAVCVERPAEGLLAAVVQCFRRRATVNLADLRENMPSTFRTGNVFPRGAFFAPVVFGSETLGVIETLRGKRFGTFHADELAAIQMIADLVAAALKLQTQESDRGKLMRAEKLAAAGQLIASAAASLGPSADRILSISNSLPVDTLGNQLLLELRAEALHLSETISRLMMFAGGERSQVQQLDLNAVLSELVQFRSRHWTELGLRVQNRLSPEPAFVLGQISLLEHAFLDLLIQAERHAAGAVAKMFAISSSRLAGRVVVEISFPTNDETTSPVIEEESWKVCSATAQNHGGELHLHSHRDGMAFEIELPLAEQTGPARAASRETQRQGRLLTLMLVDTDRAASQQLLGLMAKRGHRIVPVAAEESAVLAQRIRFDGVIWAVRPGGPKWSDYQQGLRELIPAFVLVSTGYDDAFASSLAEGGGFLLARPVQENELDRLLDAMGSKTTARV